MESSRQIEDRAAAWLAKRDSGEWSESDQVELDRWLTTTAHRVAYVRLATVWNQTHRLQALGAGTEPGVVPPPGQWRLSPFLEAAENRAEGSEERAESVEAALREPEPARPTRRVFIFSRGRLFSGVAAGLVVLMGAGALAYFLWPAGTYYRTPVGGLASVPLSDGSKVTLNTNSEIRIAVTAKDRGIELQAGEAFFEVAPDASRPFVVRAADKRIIAIGTKFSVRRDGDNVRVVVTEGKVRVEQAEETSEPAELLLAGQTARAGNAGTLVQTKPVPAAEEILSWRTGYVVFRETPLLEAVAEINRYNERKIVIQDSEVADIRLSGSFRSTNFEAFVRLLEEGFPVIAERSGEGIVLRKR